MTRTAIITGANRGLGLETTRQLAAHGWRVFAASRDTGKGAKVLRSLRTKGSIEVVPLDVSDPESVMSLGARLEEEVDAVDALINNAGVALDGFDADVARRTLDVNLYGAANVYGTVLPLLREGGCVVNVSSGMGELSTLTRDDLRTRLMDPTLTWDAVFTLAEEFVDAVASGTHTRVGWPSSAYRVSKTLLNAWTRVTAQDLGERARVNAVCPGWVRTDMGGRWAERNVEDGADTIVWAAMLPPDGPTGGFFRDRAPAEW